jgi:hypothetical protein
MVCFQVNLHFTHACEYYSGLSVHFPWCITDLEGFMVMNISEIYIIYIYIFLRTVLLPIYFCDCTPQITVFAYFDPIKVTKSHMIYQKYSIVNKDMTVKHKNRSAWVLILSFK